MLFRSHTTDNQTYSVCHLRILKLRENHSPDYTRVMEQAEWKLLPKAVAMVCSGEIK